jgi:rod shape-determining protein MreD
MKNFLIYVFFVYLALAIQGLVFHGIKPDLALILVCFFSVRHELGSGMAFGALTGLLIDVSSGFVLGPHILSKSVAAYLARTIRDNIFQWNIIISTVVVAVASAVDIFAVQICYETFSKVSFSNRPWGVAVASIAYTVVVSLLLYSLFHRERNEILWTRE